MKKRDPLISSEVVKNEVLAENDLAVTTKEVCSVLHVDYKMRHKKIHAV